MIFHPKTSGAAIGGALGILIAAILHSISGVHLTPEAYAAIPTFLSTFGAWLTPINIGKPKPGVQWPDPNDEPTKSHPMWKPPSQSSPSPPLDPPVK